MNWSATKQTLLRFLFIYWVLYIFPYGFEYLYWLDTNDLSFWTKITQWFGEEFLGWTFNPDQLAKGFDSKYDFARFILCAVLSALLSILWAWIDSKKNWQYQEKIHTLLRVLLRYHVGFTLILYGIAKVYTYQFGYMGLDRMDTAVGDHSPMGFLWLFMSYSPTYNIATGLIEMIGGMLLLFRRSVLIGSLISFIAMCSVVLIDIAYDVSVKMFAIHLWLMLITLMAKDFRRLINVLILNRQTHPVVEKSLFSGSKSKKVGYVLKTLLLGYILIYTFDNSGKIKKRRDAVKTQSFLNGKYIVESFILNNDTLPPAGQSFRWKEMTIGSSYVMNQLTIKGMNDTNQFFIYQADTINKRLNFHALNDSTDSYMFHYSEPGETEFNLFGTYQKDSIQIKMSIFKRDDFQLGRGKITWIRDL